MIESRDHDALAQLVLDRAPALVRQGRFATAESWLRALPSERVGRSAWLSFWLGQCEAARSPSGGRPHLERAYALFKSADDPAGMFLAWAAFVDTFFYVWDRFGPLDPWIEELGALRRRHPSFPSREVEARVTFGAMSALMWRKAADPDLDTWVERARALLRTDLEAEPRMRLASCLVFLLVWWRGDHAEAARLLAEVRPTLDEPDVAPATEILWRVMEAAYHARVSGWEACIEAVERGLAKAKSSGVVGLNQTLAIQGVYGALAAGDLALARRYHELARDHMGLNEATNIGHFHFLGVWIALCANDLVGAESHARPLAEQAGPSGADFVGSWIPHTAAHLLAARGRYGDALHALSRASDWARERKSAVVAHHCLLSEAHVLLLAGREREAVETLREAMALGRERGYVMHPWIGWRREVMARLAALALENGVEPDHVRAQIRAGRLPAPDSVTTLDRWPWPVRMYTLGPFELWRGDERAVFTGKVQRKPLELLQALVALGARDVREEVLEEALWSDSEGDAARHALEMTVYRLRKLLGAPEAIVQRDRRLSLDTRLCWIDTLALQWRLGQALVAVEAGRPIEEDARRIAHLYRGPFLAEGGDDPEWAAVMRARLRRELSRLLAGLERRLAVDDRNLATSLRERLAEVDAELGPAVGRSRVG